MLNITILVDNETTKSNLETEHGFSVLLESNEGIILFDTGQSDMIIRNAKALDIDLSKIDYIILSHGHYDHTGGLEAVLKETNNVLVCAHQDVFGKKYGKKDFGNEYIGIDTINNFLINSAQAQFNKKPKKLTEHFLLSGEIPYFVSFERPTENFIIQKETNFIPDSFIDEQALIISTEKGLVVIVGCAHRGLINTLYYAKEITKEEHIFLAIGGTHLGNATQERLDLTVEALRELKVEHLGLSHCTGLTSYEYIRDKLGEDIVFYAGAGMEFKV